MYQKAQFILTSEIESQVRMIYSNEFITIISSYLQNDRKDQINLAPETVEQVKYKTTVDSLFV